ncbi:cadherin-like domain-containing protein, partial [Aestuariicoccus sp. MJ-SS9]|uniref:cadherin-like domain-containing protein n=1 Tax=Aestuariicoccus sp. MJ-SS9 TaxID=3079855 RepID=UPI00290D55AB
LTTVAVTDPANGSVAINGDGTVTYTPNANFSGNDRFMYTIRDIDGATSTATVTVEVTPVNDPPVANDDTAATDEDTPTTIRVLANDTDVDDGVLAIVSASNGTNGLTVVSGDTVIYTPNDNFFGTDSFTYTIQDSAGVPATATVDVTVNAVNDAPVPANAAIVINEADGLFALDLRTQVTDVDGDTLSFSQVGIQRGETLIPFTITGDGLISIDPDLGLDLGVSLSTTLVYTVNDGSGAPNATASGFVPITFNGADDPAPSANLPPVANDVSVTGDEADGAVSISLSTLVSDPNIGDILTITSLRTSAADPELPNARIDFSGGVTGGEGGRLIIDTATLLGFFADDGETRTFLLDYTVEDAAGLTDSGVITLDLIGETPGGNTPPNATDIITPPGEFPQTDPFSGQPVPTDIIVGETGAAALVIDLDAPNPNPFPGGPYISDPDSGPSPLTVTMGDLVIGFDEATGTPITVPVGFDSATNEVTITVDETFPLADGESAIGTISYSVFDGLDTTSATITFNYVNPDDTPPGPQQTTLDFEEFSADPGAEITIAESQGFVFSGAATVFETDELTGGDSRNPSGIVSGQTTDPGDNVLVGTSSFIDAPVLDETGEPVLDDREDPVFETVLDKTFAIRGPGSTVEIGDEGVPFAAFTPGTSFPVGDPPPEEFGAAFDLNGLSLNPVAGDGVVVTLTTYRLAVVENGPNDFNPSANDYFTRLVAADTFTFTVDASTPATVIDFEAATLPGGIANTDPTVFDDLYAVEFTTADGTPIVFDDILLTV